MATSTPPGPTQAMAAAARALGATVERHNRVTGVERRAGGYGHRTSRSYAFAFVEPRLARAGTALAVVILEEERAATVLSGPAYDPTNRRIKS